MKSTIDKISRTAAILIAAALFLSAQAFAAPVPPDISIGVEAGYGGTARVGALTPFRISLENKGSEISGEVQVLTDTDLRTKAAYAVPFSLAQGSSKVIAVNAPVNTANKKVQVQVTVNGKTVKKTDYEFKKLISPQTPTIGVLSDDFDAFRSLNGMKLAESTDPGMAGDIRQKIAVSRAAGVSIKEAALPDRPSELIALDSENMPEDIKSLNAFDIIIINNFDTYTLSKKACEALEKWIEGGGLLVIGTGSGAGKAYSGLPESLRPFKLDNESDIAVPEALKSFTEKEIPSGNLKVTAVRADQGRILFGDAAAPLAVACPKGLGYITALAFDPAVSPISDWQNLQDFWRKLVDASLHPEEADPAVQDGTPYNPPVYGNLQGLASRVPETQSPPFNFLIWMVGVYVLVAGPLIYLFLKRKDKRDLSWAAIPLIALLFTGIIYVAGYKTRYTTAVLNTFSVLEVNPVKSTATVSTCLAAFNNIKGSMAIEYGGSENLDLNMNQYYYDYPYPANDTASSIVTSKVTYSDPVKYEFFDSSIWNPRFIYTSKDIPMQGGILNSISIADGRFKTIIKNNTDYAFNEAFLVVGNNFIYAGNIYPGEEKQIDTALNDPSVKKRFDDYLDSRYGQVNFQSRKPITGEEREKYRVRNVFENTYNSLFNRNMGQSGISLFALSNMDPDYNLVINGKAPKEYNTSIIHLSSGLDFEKGSRVSIPSGIISPVLDSGKNKNAYFDTYMGSVRINEDGDVDFSFKVPDNIAAEKATISWSTFLPSYLKYRPQNPKAPGQPMQKNTYKYYIYNNSTSQWQETGEKFDLEPAASYIGPDGKVKARVNAVIDRSAPEGELLGIPEFELSGVVK